MKFIKLIKSSDYEKYLKDIFKDYYKTKIFEKNEFSLKIGKNGHFYISMIKPYSMNTKWPWAVSNKPLITEEYEALDQSDYMMTDFDIYQSGKRVNQIFGDMFDVFKELINLSEGLEYMADRS